MTCPGCAHENRLSAKFCEECAAPLPRLCPSCGAGLRPAAKFCDECGASLATRPVETAGARKVVTIVFADLVGSTALHERLDPESARLFMEGYYRAMRGAVETHGGAVTQLLGDGVKAVFGAPRVAEDDAIRAVRAAVEMQHAFRELAQQQRGRVGKTGLRVAVNTGEVVANDEAEIIGDPVNVAARLQEQGRDGDVVIGDATQRLVAALVTLAPLGSFALKGRSEAVKAYRVVSLDAPVGAKATAFVGRESEIARIREVYATAISKPAACLTVLLGSPGLGKSRLIEEFTRRLGDAATVVTAQCDAAGGASFAPLSKALRGFLHLDDGASADTLRAALEAALPGDAAERARIVAGITALLSGSPASPEETFFVVRRLLGALGAAKPVVLVIDDLHWAEPLLLDLVEHLVQWGSGVPLLLLVGARPELRDTRSSLATPGPLVADVLALAGLDAGAATRLAANVIGAADLPAAVAAKVLAASEGNPLFVGELVRMLVHEGALRQEGERWTTGATLAALEMPPTIQALLAARLERLRPEDRSVLERAAVVGRHFSRSAVATLLPRDVTDLDARLESLRRSELIERDTGWLLGEPVLRFHHVLIRDAAYRRLLKGTRAELHGRFADWIEARAGEAIEHDETIGWHLEQAHQHLRELGPLDASGRALGERAARRLAAAGRRALARDDAPLAASLLGRALACLDAEDPARADLALDWCEAVLSAGDVGSAAAAIDELGRFTGNSARLRAWHTCFSGQLTVLTAPQALHATADAVAAAAEALAAQGDGAGEAKAHQVHALALQRLGKVGACEAALDRALAAARRAGDHRRSNAVLAGAPLAALWGPSPVTRASGRCLDVVRVLRLTQGSPAVEAVALSCQGVLEALRGRTEAARRMIAASRKLVEELGITHRLLEADVVASRIDLLEGDAAAAERGLRGAYEGLRDLGLGIDAARAAALLSRALLAQGRAAEAEAVSHESEALAGDDLQAAIAWRGVRAEALARRGEHVAAVELAQTAVAIAAATDALLDHADARLALAAALRAAGRSSEADAEERRAIELWEAKGATLLAERARRDGAHVAPVAPTLEDRAEPARPVRRRVRPNATTAIWSRFDAACAARDVDALGALYGDAFEEINHPTGARYGREGALASLRRFWRSRDAEFRAEPLATLGESLALVRNSFSASGTGGGRFDVGAYEREDIQVTEVDEHGRFRCAEVFGDRLGDAVARLYERHAELLPDGPARTRAAATARSVQYLAGPADLDAACATLAPTAELVDHRLLGFGSIRGIEALREYYRALFETESFAFRVDDVLRLESDAILILHTTAGTARTGGGAYERRFLQLISWGDDGLTARVEHFVEDREAEAFARFDELTAARPAASRFANAASRALDRMMATFIARDWEGYLRLLPVGFRMSDRRPMMSLEVDRGQWIEYTRQLGDMGSTRIEAELLATRGDRLSLSRQQLEVAEGAVGPSRIDSLFLVETNDCGEPIAVVRFAPDDLEAAYAELDARFEAGEAAIHPRASSWAAAFRHAFAARDWDAMAALSAPDQVAQNHRLVGWGTRRGRAAWAPVLQALVELASDTRLRIDHLRTSDFGFLWTSVWQGTRDGGAYETPWIHVVEVDERGQEIRVDVYDIEMLAQARARFDEIVARTLPPAPRFANAATRAEAELVATFQSRDHERFAELLPSGFRYSDRRRMAQLELDRDQYFEFAQALREMGAGRLTKEVLATRGERLALHRLRFDVADADVGPSEVEVLDVLETDERGAPAARVRFDADDLDAAYAELDVRYEAGEAAAQARASAWVPAFTRAISGRDWNAVIELCAPSLDAHDHRLVGWGTLKGPAAWVGTQRTLVELAPDARFRLDHQRTCERGVLIEGVWLGTRDGGAFEIAVVGVIELDEGGRNRRFDLYDLGQLAQARARFEELTTVAPSLARFANAASRAWDELVAAFRARDWQRYKELMSDGFRFSDRKKGLARLELDRDQRLEYVRPLGDMSSVRSEHELLATRGERLALGRLRLEVAEGDVGPSEIVSLFLTETNRGGEIVAYVRFDADDLDAAHAELDARYDAGEAAVHGRVSALMRARSRAWACRDWEAIAAQLGPALVCHDHRLLGWGTLRGAAAWVQTQQSLVELAPDVRTRVDHVRISERGSLTEQMGVGSRDGGAFELAYLRVNELDELGKIQRIDLYDPGQLEQARARFDEIGARAVPDPLRIPPNASTWANDRWWALAQAEDWDAVRELTAGMVFEDRRRLIRIAGGSELLLADTRHLWDSGWRPTRTLLATAGDRLSLERMLWTLREDGQVSEIEVLKVSEIDADGRIVAYTIFDADDLRAASAELFERWVRLGADAILPASIEFFRTWNDHDLGRMRALLPDDYVFHDHRRTGIGRVEGADAYVASLAALYELGPDVRLHMLYQVAQAQYGFVSVAHSFGTNAEGGAFEAVFVALSLSRGGRQVGAELFELDDLDAALARFEELRPDVG